MFFFLLEECLEYGLVAPFPAYGFATLVSHNENLNSLKQLSVKAVRLYGFISDFTKAVSENPNGNDD